MAGTQVSFKSLASSSCASQLAFIDVPVSTSGGEAGSESPEEAIEAIG